ncbi:hypothetical protein APR04_001255 [Promicromonospora umidemergens]|uniref:Deazaflavin-dependent oxidoreductase (Nitroreductase family) n=1 Tax=Promicromonospora umidemergens TaxID=629679 RepID=A0ABP8Y6Q6_9MICO|nr:hypothetical protein [Promicromonospora umidemergens]MCP2282357.1 hypothetical protein [Promicromonospora umidemergens]
MRTNKQRIGRAVDGFNARVLAMRSSPRWGRLVRRHLTVVTYTGRRSGRTFSIPVGYRRTGDTVEIGVRLADQKNWWRNFTGEGGPISVELDGIDRTGHAIARQDGLNASVSVRLHQPGPEGDPA